MSAARRGRTFAVAVVLVAFEASAQNRSLCLREAVSAVCPNGTMSPVIEARASTAHATAARAALETARAQFLASSFREAAATMQIAAAAHVEHLVRDERALALEVLYWAGACSLLSGDREGARQTFQRALALAPEGALPSSVFSPDVEAFFTELRYQAAVAVPVTRTVRTQPEGARVEVDGRDEGRSPVTLRLSAGPHYLRVERLGYRTWFGLVVLDALGTDAIQIVLTEATGPELRAQLGHTTFSFDLLDEATLARVRDEYRVDRVVLALRDGSTRVHPPLRPFPWLWVGIGAAVAVGAGVGMYFLLRPEPVFHGRWQ